MRRFVCVDGGGREEGEDLGTYLTSDSLGLIPSTLLPQPSKPLPSFAQAVVVGISVQMLTRENTIKHTYEEVLQIKELSKRPDVLTLLANSLVSVLVLDIELWGGVVAGVRCKVGGRGAFPCFALLLMFPGVWVCLDIGGLLGTDSMIKAHTRTLCSRPISTSTSPSSQAPSIFGHDMISTHTLSLSLSLCSPHYSPFHLPLLPGPVHLWPRHDQEGTGAADVWRPGEEPKKRHPPEGRHQHTAGGWALYLGLSGLKGPD
jgi:hypothetical protein